MKLYVKKYRKSTLPVRVDSKFLEVFLIQDGVDFLRANSGI